MNGTYEKFLTLPLFQGLGKNELMELVGQTRFDFLKVVKGTIIVKEHERSERLFFLQNGILQQEHFSDNHSYSFKEYLSAPTVIERERLLGLYQHYANTYQAMNECHLIAINKQEALNIVNKYTVFRYNLMGLIATKAQRLSMQVWHNTCPTTEQRLIRFVKQHCSTPTGHKILHIKMATLAEEINDSRLSVSQVLRQWKTSHLVELKRGYIIIPSFETLLRLKVYR